jgi:hypothetical protein
VDYRTRFNQYAALYRNTYVSCYESYNASLDDLADRIRSVEITTQAQANRIFAFLKEIRSENRDFFGTRSTPGKSRYDVLHYRSAMHTSAASKNYETAILLLDHLIGLINDRISFLMEQTEKIATFDVDTGSNNPYGSISNVYISSVHATDAFYLHHLYKAIIDDTVVVLTCTMSSPDSPYLTPGLYRNIPLNADGSANESDFGSPQTSVTAISYHNGILETTGSSYTVLPGTRFFTVNASCSIQEVSAEEIAFNNPTPPYAGNSELIVVANSGLAYYVYIFI